MNLDLTNSYDTYGLDLLSLPAGFHRQWCMARTNANAKCYYDIDIVLSFL